MEEPDVVGGWDRLARAYQREIGWPDDRLMWGFRCPPEDELQLVSDVVADATTLVVGCGGGQDLVALHGLGAGPLIGIDPSREQLELAHQRLAAAEIPARLSLGTAEEMPDVGDDSVDLVVSVQALNYVDDLAAAVRELRRVLSPGGIVAFSVLHPADVSTADEPPYGWHTSWFEVQRDWSWDGLTAQPVRFRSWFRSAADWFTALTDGGMVVERLLEPSPIEDRSWIERGWLDEATYTKLETVPGTILARARVPG